MYKIAGDISICIRFYIFTHSFSKLFEVYLYNTVFCMSSIILAYLLWIISEYKRGNDNLWI